MVRLAAVFLMLSLVGCHLVQTVPPAIVMKHEVPATPTFTIIPEGDSASEWMANKVESEIMRMGYQVVARPSSVEKKKFATEPSYTKGVNRSKATVDVNRTDQELDLNALRSSYVVFVNFYAMELRVMLLKTQAIVVKKELLDERNIDVKVREMITAMGLK